MKEVINKNNELLYVGQKVSHISGNDFSYDSFIIGGFFTSTDGTLCAYKMNHLGEYYGNSGDITEYCQHNDIHLCELKKDRLSTSLLETSIINIISIELNKEPRLFEQLTRKKLTNDEHQLVLNVLQWCGTYVGSQFIKDANLLNDNIVKFNSNH